VKFLLDVNVLLALAFGRHVHHERVSRWVAGLQRRGPPALLTSAITELGFVRVAAQPALFGVSIVEAKTLLQRLKRAKTVTFQLVPDEVGADALPGWVRRSDQTTDGHLLELARRHEAELATLDKGVTGAFLLPD
jgi:toxin-antitoxin system PIN domain toxin